MALNVCSKVQRPTTSTSLGDKICCSISPTPLNMEGGGQVLTREGTTQTSLLAVVIQAVMKYCCLLSEHLVMPLSKTYGMNAALCMAALFPKASLD